MTIRPIRYLGDPVLRSPTRRVRRVNRDIQLLVADMIETLVDISGAGLAAPQVHTSLRIVMFHVPEARAVDEGGNNSDGVPFTILLNPEIEAIGSHGKVWKYKGLATVEGKKMADAQWSATIVDRK